MSTAHRSIFLHVGLCKTGTTTTQHFLDKNYEALASFGLLYPRTGLEAHHHYMVAKSFKQNSNLDRRTRRVIIEHLRAELQSWPGNVILSSEHFSFLDEAEIEALSKMLGPHTQVIVVLREQVHWTTAMYAEAVRWGYQGSFADHIRSQWASLDYATFLRPWEHSFGRKNMNVLVYDIKDVPYRILAVARIPMQPPSLLAPPLRLLPTLPAEFIAQQRKLSTGEETGFKHEASLHSDAATAQEQRKVSKDFRIPEEFISGFVALEEANNEICRNHDLPRPLFGREIEEIIRENLINGHV